MRSALALARRLESAGRWGDAALARQAARAMRLGRPALLASALRALEPRERDALLARVDPRCWPAVGIEPRDSARAAAEYERRFGKTSK